MGFEDKTVRFSGRASQSSGKIYIAKNKDHRNPNKQRDGEIGDQSDSRKGVEPNT